MRRGCLRAVRERGVKDERQRIARTREKGIIEKSKTLDLEDREGVFHKRERERERERESTVTTDFLFFCQISNESSQWHDYLFQSQHMVHTQ
jgi:hypothetical protein